MSTVTVSGASDDLIEIKGDLSEEFNGSEEPRWLAFSDGTLLTIQYGVGGGFWRISVLAKGTAAIMKKDGTDEESDYSDSMTLTGDDLAWVVCGDRYEKIGGKRRKR